MSEVRTRTDDKSCRASQSGAGRDNSNYLPIPIQRVGSGGSEDPLDMLASQFEAIYNR